MRRSGIVSLLFLLAGCMYSFSGSGAGGGLPSHIKTVAIIPFENLTATPEIQRELTETLRSELQSRLGLRDAPESRANSIVRGTIQRYETDIPIGFNANNRQTTSARRMLRLTIDLELVDQVSGKTLLQRKGMSAEGQYDERGEAEGRKQAVKRIIDDIIQGAQSQW